MNPPLILLALGDDAQLIRSPNSSDSSFERVAFCGSWSSGSGSGTSRSVGWLVGAKVLPNTNSLVLGRLFCSSQSVETTQRSEDTSVPLLVSQDL